MNNLDKIMMVKKACNKEEMCIGDDPLPGTGNFIHFCVYLFIYLGILKAFVAPIFAYNVEYYTFYNALGTICL